MNPMDYWYAHSKRYRETCDRYFNENIERLLINHDLYHEARDIYLNENKQSIESKQQILTILAVLKIYFNF
jgi:3-methyladenine DNA glycosylase AlkD